MLGKMFYILNTFLSGDSVILLNILCRQLKLNQLQVDVSLPSFQPFLLILIPFLGEWYNKERIVGVTSDKCEKTRLILSSTLFSNPRLPPICSFTLHHHLHQLIEKLPAFSARITAYKWSSSFYLPHSCLPFILLTYPTSCLQSYLCGKIIIQCPCLKLLPLWSFSPWWKIKT